MTDVEMFQIDAFSALPFAGNPAAVVTLDRWRPDALLQAIAEENHLSETAFLVPAGAGEGVDYQLRWFTPTAEVDLCGHATLASAHALFEHLGHAGRRVRFGTRSGPLAVEREGDELVLDMPARPPRALGGAQGDRPEEGDPVGRPDEALQAEGEAAVLAGRIHAVLGIAPQRLAEGRDLLVELRSEAEVAALRPNPGALAALHEFAVCVTAPADPGASADDGVHFVCRFFAPNKGVPEDPVTGSAYTMLTPWWAERLGSDELVGRQLSARGGTLRCRWLREAGRVTVAGRAVTYLCGRISIPDGER